MTRRFLYMMCLLVAMMALPGQAHAFTITLPPLSLDDCTGGAYPSWAYTSKLVDCVETSIKQATFVMMDALSQIMWPIMGTLFVLATAVFGVKVAGGEGTLKDAMGFLLRLALVAMFTYNLGGYAGALFTLENTLVTIVTLGGFSPWILMDDFLGRLIGVGPTVVLAQGMIGMVGAALFSSTAGAVMFLAAFSALINLLLFIFRVVFTYLMAITVMAFLIVISPFIIPLAVFFYTERYFIRWLDTLFSAMLVPVLLFAFLSMFVNIFASLINDVYYIICGNTCVNNPAQTDFSPYWKDNQPKFGWLMPSDPNLSNRLQSAAQSGAAGKPAVQTNINPLMRRGHDAGVFNMPGIDFGPNNVSVMQKLVYAFIGLWIFASFMKSMVGKIPEIAANIANAASGVTMQQTNIERTVRRNWNKLQAAITGR